MNRALRWWSLLLVPVGFVAGHELGYTGAAALGSPAVTAGGHGYLLTLLLVGAPFAFAASARNLLAGLRDELPPVRWATLAGAQVALFAAVELAEHLHAGLSPAAIATQPAVLLGLAAQLVIAAAVVAILRTSHQAAAAIAAARRRPAALPRAPRRTGRPSALVVEPALVPVSSLSRRGPPAPSGHLSIGAPGPDKALARPHRRPRAPARLRRARPETGDTCPPTRSPCSSRSLAVAAQAGAGLLAVTLAARALAPAAAWPRQVLGAVGPAALTVAAAVAVVATLGSLYFSEVADFPPCRLCWFQRIGMYPSP